MQKWKALAITLMSGVMISCTSMAPAFAQTKAQKQSCISLSEQVPLAQEILAILPVNKAVSFIKEDFKRNGAPEGAAELTMQVIRLTDAMAGEPTKVIEKRVYDACISVYKPNKKGMV